ncbi:hypothetical protein ILUMI_01591 [Ignelater luminosus]|uniref:Uncharacterized protein n=1 Tax=Ignelater luminosus TaxID=2038154 RepID=A0A8K0DJZ3_IGNLU|nr:hypothetical protein ILUMI_01591 [Ignelater luminosus]
MGKYTLVEKLLKGKAKTLGASRKNRRRLMMNVFDEKIEKLLKDIAETEGFSDYEINKADGSIKGDGYLRIIKTATIRAKNNNRILTLVVKSASKSNALRSQIAIEDLFQRKIYMYDTVFNTFKTFEEENELQPCNFTPKLYNSLREKKYETLILENLKDSGYKLYQKNIPMNQEHVCLVLIQLGRLHELSFALKYQFPEKFKNVVECLDNCYLKTILRSKFTNNLIQLCIKRQKALDEEVDKEALDTYKAFIDTIQPFPESLLESADEYSVALNGDC